MTERIPTTNAVSRPARVRVTSQEEGMPFGETFDVVGWTAFDQPVVKDQRESCLLVLQPDDFSAVGDEAVSEARPDGMKAPRYFIQSMQDQSDAGINPFAMQLMAEAHADKPEKWGEETVLLVGHAHNRTLVYMLISTRRPTLEQFKEWPAAGSTRDNASSQDQPG